MAMSHLLPRSIGRSLLTHLGESPAVVVTGARQTGKTTLVRELAPGPRRYLALDDLDVMETARRDPERLLLGAEPVILDEVQRVPAVLSAVKRAVDASGTPGRFLLTGSANLLLMRRVSESLAGRASYLTLGPMTRREQRGLGKCGSWEDLLRVPDVDWPAAIAEEPDAPEDWRPSRAAGRLSGGRPGPQD